MSQRGAIAIHGDDAVRGGISLSLVERADSHGHLNSLYVVHFENRASLCGDIYLVYEIMIRQCDFIFPRVHISVLKVSHLDIAY